MVDAGACDSVLLRGVRSLVGSDSGEIFMGNSARDGDRGGAVAKPLHFEVGTEAVGSGDDAIVEAGDLA